VFENKKAQMGKTIRKIIKTGISWLRELPHASKTIISYTKLDEVKKFKKF
jgi:hypothetical protein